MKVTIGRMTAAAMCSLVVWSCSGERPAAPTIRLENFQVNLDPSTMSDIESRGIATMLHAGLVAVDSSGHALPRLAKSWQKIDSLTWEFQLQSGARFGNGDPATAAAAQRSLCWSMQPAHLYSWALRSISHTTGADGRVNCDGLVAVNDSTLRIRETRPAPWLLEALDSPAGWIVGDAGDKAAAWGERPGLGPFRLASVASGSQVVLVKRDGGVVAAQVDSVIFKHVPDPQTGAAELGAGAIDFMRVDAPAVAQVLEQRGVTVHRHSFGRVRVLLANAATLANRGFKPEQFRLLLEGIGSSVDRAAIAREIGDVARPLLTAFPPSAVVAANNLATKPAVQNLPTAALRVITPNDPLSDAIGSRLPRQVGPVTISHTAIDPSLLFSQFLGGNAEMMSILIEPTLSAPTFWAAFWAKGSPFVAFGRELARMDTVDLTTSTGVSSFGALVDSQGTWVGLVAEDGRVASSKRLRGLRFTKSGQVSFEGISVGR
jgi:ABC-type transport system substrate-binding protein